VSAFCKSVAVQHTTSQAQPQRLPWTCPHPWDQLIEPDRIKSIGTVASAGDGLNWARASDFWAICTPSNHAVKRLISRFRWFRLFQGDLASGVFSSLCDITCLLRAHPKPCVGALPDAYGQLCTPLGVTPTPRWADARHGAFVGVHTPSTASTSPLHVPSVGTRALQRLYSLYSLYNLYSSTALHHLQYTSLYSTPLHVLQL
jgi:hypothetical protein